MPQLSVKRTSMERDRGDAIKIQANLLETMAKISKEIPREIAGSNEARSIVKILISLKTH